MFVCFAEVLTETSTEVAFGQVWIDSNGRIKVSNGQHMIAHVLIDSSSSNVHCLIAVYFLNDFCETSQSFLEVISSMIHQTKMELTAYEVWLKLQSLLIHFYCSLIAILIVFACLLKDEFGLTLESKTFGVP